MRIIFLTISVLFFISTVNSQTNSYTGSIRWLHISDSIHQDFPYTFANVTYPDRLSNLPYFNASYNVSAKTFSEFRVLDYDSVLVSASQLAFFQKYLTDSIAVAQNYGTTRNQSKCYITFCPVWIKANAPYLYRVKKYAIQFNVFTSQRRKQYTFAENSVLASGNWYKIKITDDGVYKISYSELKDMGFSDPAKVRLFGNGGLMLPKSTDSSRIDDLQEVSISFVNGSDSKFGEGDYLLFFGKGPNQWTYNKQNNCFYHTLNKYSECAYYFLTDNFGAGKEIGERSPIPDTNALVVNTYDDLYFHENDLVNLFHSGSTWYGENIATQQSKTISIPLQGNIDAGNAFFYYNLVGRSDVDSWIELKAGDAVMSGKIESIVFEDNEGVFANQFSGQKTITLAAGSKAEIKASFLCDGSNESEAYINYFGLNITRPLNFQAPQLIFQNKTTNIANRVAQYTISNVTDGVEVWDVTNFLNPEKLTLVSSNQSVSFVAKTDSLRRFIAFSKISGFLAPVLKGSGLGKLKNQNIHGMPLREMLIVCPNDTGMLTQTKRFAAYREQHSGIKSNIVMVDDIYNEFSSGQKDVTALRDMVKMFYERSIETSSPLKYVLLFGSCTYVMKQNKTSNNNLVPTYESDNSLVQNASYATDDFFGWMNYVKPEASNLLDIGIGRFPVSDAIEAEKVVDKIMRYESYSNQSDWQNIVCFIADDEDNNLHVDQSDEMAENMRTSYPWLNIQKIFLDAFQQKKTALGDQYPDAILAINRRINAGALIMNYTGHGSEKQLAHEDIIDKTKIRSWKNSEKLPLFITATCEFSRFDNFNYDNNEVKVSAGEEVFLHPEGGAISMFTTSRVVYSTDNLYLNQAIFKYLFEKDTMGNPLRLGDIMRFAKNEIASSSAVNRLNFVLLGDPSLTLAYPKKIAIFTDSINHKPIALADTIRALDFVTISGHVATPDAKIDSGFNREVSVTVFDKVGVEQTLANDLKSHVKSFKTQESIIFKGRTMVKKGNFAFAFPVPKDIQFNFDSGKVIYFSFDSTTTFAGYTSSFIVGGINQKAENDFSGPAISLFMNDTNFIDGGITDANPRLLVKLTDANGINATGSGIGHDINAVFDEDFSKIYVLNDYFQTDIDAYMSGEATYPLYNLEAGMHTISVTGWDVFNNSSVATINFEVSSYTDIKMSKVYNFPNPFSASTSFVIEHNWAEKPVSTEIRIFNISGGLVTVLTSDFTPNGFRTPDLVWNGRNSNGREMSSGMYLYTVILTAKNGKQDVRNGKMIIVR